MKVIVIGPRGKMGKLITQVAASRDDMELVGAIAPKGRDYIGKDLGTVAMTGFELGVPVTDDLEVSLIPVMSSLIFPQKKWPWKFWILLLPIRKHWYVDRPDFPLKK